MLFLLQSLLIIVLTLAGMWALARWAGPNRRAIRDTVRNTAQEVVSAHRSKRAGVGGATAEQIGRALANSLRGERGFFSRTVKVVSGNYVIYCHPMDYPKITGGLQELISELMDYLREAARETAITLVNGRESDGRPRAFELNVVQVLVRDDFEPGFPALVTYARARSLELASQGADGLSWTPAQNQLLEPHQLPGADRTNLGASESPKNADSGPGDDSWMPQADVPEPATPWSPSSCTAVRVAARAPSRVAYLEVLEIPEGTEPMASFITIIDRAAYGRAQQLGPAAFPVGKVSRYHFMTEWNGGWELHDLQSQHGTFVNGEAVVSPVRLCDGDEIVLGDAVRLAVHVPSADGLDAPTDD